MLFSRDADIGEYSVLRVHSENRDAQALSGGGRVYGEGAEEGLQEKEEGGEVMLVRSMRWGYVSFVSYQGK